jgi:hypothetical protein
LHGEKIIFVLWHFLQTLNAHARNTEHFYTFCNKQKLALFASFYYTTKIPTNLYWLPALIEKVHPGIPPSSSSADEHTE